MHSYEAARTTRVAGAIAGVSIPLVWLMDSVLVSVGLDVPTGSNVPYVAVLLSAVYAVIYYAFDYRIWRFGLLRKCHLVKIPYLGGTWNGYVQYSYDNWETKYEISIVIKQRWSAIAIWLDTNTSRSRSVSATLRTDLPFPELSYRYLNQPKPNAPTTMEAHEGTTVLELRGDALAGEYYTGRGRMQRGLIRLKRA